MTIQNMPELPPGFYWSVSEPCVDIAYNVYGSDVRRFVSVNLYLLHEWDEDNPAARRTLSFTSNQSQYDIQDAIRAEAKKLLDAEPLSQELLEHYALLSRLHDVAGRTDGEDYW